MRGAIRKSDIVGHPLITYRTFGWKVLSRALLAGGDRTFLSIVQEVDPLRGRKVYVPEIVERCIALELRARDLYGGFARQFAADPNARRCFETLASQESEHAELLELCREVAARGRWDGSQFRVVEGLLAELEKSWESVEQEADRARSVRSALRVAIAIESSEVNRAFRTIVRSCDAEFVRTMKPFRDACRRHLEYLRSEAVQLDPALAGELEPLNPDRFRE